MVAVIACLDLGFGFVVARGGAEARRVSVGVAGESKVSLLLHRQRLLCRRVVVSSPRSSIKTIERQCEVALKFAIATAYKCTYPTMRRRYSTGVCAFGLTRNLPSEPCAIVRRYQSKYRPWSRVVCPFLASFGSHIINGVSATKQRDHDVFPHFFSREFSAVCHPAE